MNRGFEQGRQLETVTVNTLIISIEQTRMSFRDLAAYIAQRVTVPQGYKVRVRDVDDGLRANGNYTEPCVRYSLVPVFPTKRKHSLF